MRLARYKTEKGAAKYAGERGRVFKMRLTIQPNGDLLLQASNNDRADLAYALNCRGFWPAFTELFEPFSCNGSYTPFDAGEGNPFVGLTSAPCIAESMATDDAGNNTVVGRLWWFPDYCLRDPLDELKRKGRTVFTLAREE